MADAKALSLSRAIFLVHEDDTRASVSISYECAFEPFNLERFDLRDIELLSQFFDRHRYWQILLDLEDGGH